MALLLSQAKVDVNARNKEGFSALLYAAQKGRAAVAKALLEAGADAGAKLAAGTSALALAQAEGHDATARALEGSSDVADVGEASVGKASSEQPADLGAPAAEACQQETLQELSTISEASKVVSWTMTCKVLDVEAATKLDD